MTEYKGMKPFFCELEDCCKTSSIYMFSFALPALLQAMTYDHTSTISLSNTVNGTIMLQTVDSYRAH